MLKKVGAGSFPQVESNVKSVAQYYYRLGNGGAERVVAALSSMFRSMEKQSTVFVGCEPDADSYLLEDEVHLEVLPECLNEYPDPCVIRHRMERLKCCLSEFSVDAYVCHQWVSPQSIWDLLLCKALGVRFILVAHGVFSFSLANLLHQAHFWTMPYEVALCDAVVCLSETNRFYYSKFNSNTFSLPNPLYEELRAMLRSSSKACDGERPIPSRYYPTILWVGRFEPGKHPEDAINAFKIIVEAHPNARLLMLGKSEDGCYEATLQQRAIRAGVAEAVEFCGYSADVKDYYERSDVFLFTSEMEGYPIVLLEAAAAGIPVVMYDLPYLATSGCSDWISVAPICDIGAMAARVVEIVGNPQRIANMSTAARRYAESLAQYDLAGAWGDVLSCGSRDDNVFESGEVEGVFWDTLFDHGAIRDWMTQLEFDDARLDGESAVRREFEASTSWKMGRLVTALPRRILGRG